MARLNPKEKEALTFAERDRLRTLELLTLVCLAGSTLFSAMASMYEQGIQGRLRTETE